MLTPAEWIAAAGLLVASYTDAREQKIYNWLTFPLMVVGLAVNATIGQGLVFSLIGLLAAFALHFTLFAVGVERAGDSKLAMGLGALVGWSLMLETTVWTLLLLLPIGIAVLAIRGRLGNLKTVAHHVAARAQGIDVKEPPPLTLMAFGPTMACAAVVARTTDWLLLW
jgi:Flp pilus assembly protein protease CpaA